MATVQFFNADVGFTLTGKRRWKVFLGDLFLQESKILQELSIVFCSDDYLYKLNVDFLQHDTLTDIITFDLTKAGNPGTTGEMYISIDRVIENSQTLLTTFEEELSRVILHGALHLCGYKDKKKSEITLIRQKEEYYLRLLEAK